MQINKNGATNRNRMRTAEELAQEQKIMNTVSINQAQFEAFKDKEIQNKIEYDKDKKKIPTLVPIFLIISIILIIIIFAILVYNNNVGK